MFFTPDRCFFSSSASNCKVAFQPSKRVGDTWKASKPTYWKKQVQWMTCYTPALTHYLPHVYVWKQQVFLVPEIQNKTGNKSNSSEIYLQIFNSLGPKVIFIDQRYNQLKNYPRNTVWTFYSSWSFQPVWNICWSQIASFPQFIGVKQISQNLCSTTI